MSQPADSHNDPPTTQATDLLQKLLNSYHVPNPQLVSQLRYGDAPLQVGGELPGGTVGSIYQELGRFGWFFSPKTASLSGPHVSEIWWPCPAIIRIQREIYTAFRLRRGGYNVSTRHDTASNTTPQDPYEASLNEMFAHINASWHLVHFIDGFDPQATLSQQKRLPLCFCGSNYMMSSKVALRLLGLPLERQGLELDVLYRISAAVSGLFEELDAEGLWGRRTSSGRDIPGALPVMKPEITSFGSKVDFVHYVITMRSLISPLLMIGSMSDGPASDCPATMAAILQPSLITLLLLRLQESNLSLPLQLKDEMVNHLHPDDFIYSISYDRSGIVRIYINYPCLQNGGDGWSFGCSCACEFRLDDEVHDSGEYLGLLATLARVRRHTNALLDRFKSIPAVLPDMWAAVNLEEHGHRKL